MAKFCGSCGTSLQENAKFCPVCGQSTTAPVAARPQPVRQAPQQPYTGIVCPRCGAHNVFIQTVQENMGSTTTSVTKSKYKEKRHGIIWWLFIGSWWWIIDLFLWVFLFVPRALLHIGRRKTYKGKAVTTASTTNRLVYRTICTCQTCGASWENKR